MARSASRSVFAPVASAVLLYVFLVAFQVATAAVLPWLFDLWERSPRLGALAFLAFIASPAGLVAVAHRATHRTLHRLDGDGAPRRLVSTRAGLFAWFVISFASLASGLLLLAIFPPPPGEDALASLWHVATDVRLQAGVHALLWIGVAALLYHVDAVGAERG